MNPLLKVERGNIVSDEQKGILLESGTNELEIVTFNIGKNVFCINVMKVREIIHPIPVTDVPDAHHAIEGVLQVRGEIIPVINLARALNIEPSRGDEDSKFIISELNKMKVVFRVDEVDRIQRISWSQIEQPSSLAMGLEDTTSGIVKLDDSIILMLDYEKLVFDITPNAGVDVQAIKRVSQIARDNKTIYIAEDSTMLSKMLEDILTEAGYTQLSFFNNGESALEAIVDLAGDSEDVSDKIDLLITDIEMPKMDGHHLTKRLKEKNNTKNIPVIIFSALISDELRHKGEAVGVNAQVTKPEIGKLIQTIDSMLQN